MITCTRTFGFDAGHRILNHESKCASLHGHRYTAEVTCTAPEGLDKLGRVIDFGCIKELVGGWIDDELDHRMILNLADPMFTWLDGAAPGTVVAVFGSRGVFAMQQNPTAENLVRLVFENAQRLLAERGVNVTHVRLYETPNCWADFDGKDGKS